MIDPSRSAKPPLSGAPRGTAQGTGAAPARPEHRQPEHPRPQHPAHQAPPERRHPEVGRPRQPHVEIPDVARSIPKSVPKSQKDVCALGRKYGHWQEGSPESVICGRTYDR